MSEVTLFGNSVPAASIPTSLNSRPNFIGHRVLPDTTKQLAKVRVASGFSFDAVNVRRPMVDERSSSGPAARFASITSLSSAARMLRMTSNAVSGSFRVNADRTLSQRTF